MKYTSQINDGRHIIQPQYAPSVVVVLELKNSKKSLNYPFQINAFLARAECLGASKLQIAVQAGWQFFFFSEKHLEEKPCV